MTESDGNMSPKDEKHIEQRSGGERRRRPDRRKFAILSGKERRDGKDRRDTEKDRRHDKPA